ncbi:MAG: GNAT family N-acetyltransferase [bacterium]
MVIRNMEHVDYDAVYALWLSCPGMGLNTTDDSRAGIEKYLNRNPNTCFVALEGGRVVGAILAGHDGRRGFISHTAVAPDCQHRGIGAKLVSAALDGFRREGIAKVALVAFARNEAGNAFWEKMGFTVRDDLVYRNRALAELTRIDT